MFGWPSAHGGGPSAHHWRYGGRLVDSTDVYILWWQLLASLLRATKGEECDEFMEGVRKGEMRTLQLDLEACGKVQQKRCVSCGTTLVQNRSGNREI